ncbi:hypothetical protein TcWFU_000217 [Taenia crassiceps]|uniref:Uncharacterized protein n=1 Tax=Taenia crassiceps TaxID=6207 RepID=A0ABR4Q6K2_9CEST
MAVAIILPYIHHHMGRKIVALHTTHERCSVMAQQLTHFLPDMAPFTAFVSQSITLPFVRLEGISSIIMQHWNSGLHRIGSQLRRLSNELRHL